MEEEWAKKPRRTRERYGGAGTEKRPRDRLENSHAFPACQLDFQKKSDGKEGLNGGGGAYRKEGFRGSERIDGVRRWREAPAVLMMSCRPVPACVERSSSCATEPFWSRSSPSSGSPTTRNRPRSSS